MAKTYLDFLKKYEDSLTKGGMTKNGPIITVSGVSGSGKSESVGIILDMLNGFRRVYAGGVFRRLAEEKGLSVEEFSNTRPEDVDYELDRWMLKESIPGNVVLDARLAAWVAGDWADVRILVRCPLDIRAKRVASREGLSEPDARNRLERRDSQDNKRYRDLYGVDVEDEKVYTHVIDNDGTIQELREELSDAISSFRGS
ncbi:MAG: cytidylate kinase [Candidatus Aenigmatarchaeota archaeon]|nr:MAG: cytidylate kinase [Candidatus Aenigmarchaeota archaeon]